MSAQDLEQRAQFEAWVRSYCENPKDADRLLSYNNGGYDDEEIQYKWVGFAAALRQQPAPVDLEQVDRTDRELLTEFIRICREHKPVGQWPGERLCAAIDRVMQNEKPFRFIAEADMAPERGHNGRGGDADRPFSGPRRAAPQQPAPAIIDNAGKVDAHPDDAAVDRFAAAMKAKLADARAKGRGGWQDKDDCPQQRLSDMLRAHVEKGDPRDVANFAMFLHQRGESILPGHQPAPVADDARMARALEWVRTAARGNVGEGDALRAALIESARKHLPAIEEAIAAYDPNCGARTVRVVDDAMVEWKPRNRTEAAALAKIALAHLGVVDAYIDNAIARMETNAARAQEVQP